MMTIVHKSSALHTFTLNDLSLKVYTDYQGRIVAASKYLAEWQGDDIEFLIRHLTAQGFIHHSESSTSARKRSFQ